MPVLGLVSQSDRAHFSGLFAEGLFRALRELPAGRPLRDSDFSGLQIPFDTSKSGIEGSHRCSREVYDVLKSDLPGVSTFQEILGGVQHLLFCGDASRLLWRSGHEKPNSRGGTQVTGSGYAHSKGVVTLTKEMLDGLAIGNHTLAVYAPVSGIGFKQPIAMLLLLFGGVALLICSRRRLN